MRDYFGKLNHKVEKYTQKYAGNPRKAAVKLAFWNLACCFRKLHPIAAGTSSQAKPAAAGNARQVIALQLRGGIGDQVIGCNYAWNLAKKFPELRMDLYVRKEVFSFIDTSSWKGKLLEDHQKIKEDYYDVVIRLDRYPHILSLNADVLPQLGNFNHYINLLQDFKNNFNKFFDYGTRFDGVAASYAVIIKKKRIQQADINNYLSIKEEFSYNPPIKYTDICIQCGLTHGNFITIHRGSDTSHTPNSMKLWPMKHYNTLIRYIKDAFPHLSIVQMGVNAERCPEMEGIDCNLVGKTKMDDVCTLLKYSRLHIDAEGGFVHMRHALGGGRSIVLFGPTSREFFGYSENINLRSQVCPLPCEHIIQKWDEMCIKTHRTESLCLEMLHPEEVIPFIIKEFSHV